MFVRLRLWMGCGIVFLAMGASTALAQNNGIGLFGGGAGGYGFGYFNYGHGLNNGYQTVPFYSLYPPVYYSYPVPRPYGYSPFAYPPGVATPETPQAAEMLNPYVPQDSLPKPTLQRTAGPRITLNPFVKQKAPASKVSLARERVR